MATTDEKFLNGSGLGRVIAWIKGLFQPKQMGTTADYQSKVVVTNSSGIISPGTVTTTELGTLSGIGSTTIANQLAGKMNKGIKLNTWGGVSDIDTNDLQLEEGDHVSLTWNTTDKTVVIGVELPTANTSTTGGTTTQKAGIMTVRSDDYTLSDADSYDPYALALYQGQLAARIATDDEYGVAKLGSGTEQTVAANAVSSTAGRSYAVQKNSAGQMVVNVPWTDTQTDISGKQDHNIGSGNGSKVLVTDSSGNITASPDITTTELGYLDGLTEKLSTTLGNKQDKITIANPSGTAIITAGAEMTIKPGTNVTFTKESTSGNFLEISAKDTTYSEATTSALGLVMAGSTSATGTGYTPVTVLKATAGSEQAYNGRLMVKHADGSSYGVMKLYTASGTNTDGTMTQKAVTDYVASEISSAMTDAAMFQGVVNAYTAITGTSYKKGWYWIVGTAGTYAGQKCEVGDQIWAKANKGTSAANTDFNVVQTNIDTDVYVRDTDFLSDTEINNIIATAS